MNKVNFRLRSYGGFVSAQPPDIGRSRLRSITNKCTLRHRDPDPELVPERSRRGAEGSLKSGSEIITGGFDSAQPPDHRIFVMLNYFFKSHVIVPVIRTLSWSLWEAEGSLKNSSAANKIISVSR